MSNLPDSFEDWTTENAKAAITEAIEDQVGREGFKRNRAYVEEHDHWQDGETWVGPNGGSELVWKLKVMPDVKRSFTPVNAIGEALDRAANALLKREADVDLVPIMPADEGSNEAKAQEQEARELKAALSEWWDRVKLWKHARSAAIRSRWAKRGTLRTWIPQGHLRDGTVEGEDGRERPVVLLPEAKDLAEALTFVEVDAPAPDSALVYVDPDTRQRAAIFTFKEGTEERAELWWVDESTGRTRVRILGKEGETDRADVDLRGRLPIAEMEADLLITETVRKQQDRLNFLESLITRVTEGAGFPERYTFNAEPNGIWLTEQPTEGPALEQRQFGGKTWYLHAAPRAIGAMITTDLIGVTMKTGDGEERTTPGVEFKEPTDPDYAIRAAQHGKRTLLGECKQGHVHMDATAEASGTAYQQARADYEDDLDGVRPDLEGMIRDTLEVVIAWGEAIAETGEVDSILDRYRVVVSLNVQSGQVTPEQQSQNNANMKAGTLSQETAMHVNGVEDVDAELKKIRTQPDFVAVLRKEQTSAILEFVREGVSYELAGSFVGIEEGDEALAILKRMDQTRTAPGAEEDAQDEEIAAALLAGTVAENGGPDGGNVGAEA